VTVFTRLLNAILGRSEPAANIGVRAYQRGDYAKALPLLQEAAQTGEPIACYNFGIALAEGRATPKDSMAALKQFLMAAEQGHIDAAFNVGQAYRRGDGIALDYAEAARWYTFAAKRGNHQAANELGLLYVEGKGVEQDPIEGFAWIYTGTHQSVGDANAMKNATQLVRMMTADQVRIAQERGQRYCEEYILAKRPPR
jgi:uncharacterized protein